MDNEFFSENEYSTLQLVSRFRYICAKLIPPFLHFHFSRHKPRSLSLQEAVKKIRIAFQELGGTFIKLGQMLSARPDIVGPELSDELRNLLDKQASMPFKIIKNIVEVELKTPLNHLFKSFDVVPLSTASIGQVHKAVLSTGEIVVVKIQRVGLFKQVEKDLQLFKKLTVILDLLVGSKGLRFEYLYKEFSEWIMSELDFRTEGRRADTFKHNMKDIHYIMVPQTYWQYTTSKVITSSFISGMTLNAIFDEMRKQKALSIDEVKLSFSIDGMIVAQHIIAGLFKQMFVDKFFHADLHPANLIVQKDNKVAFIDFGIIGILDTVEHTKMLLLLISLIENDPQSLIKVMISFSAESFTKEQKKTLYQQFARELHKIHG
ncbi:MAG: 2-polyprenylphenol 6-hydroxylase, partial [Candidatus Roizmanbacteria bacterium GW2011_GWA2_34_18]